MFHKKSVKYFPNFYYKHLGYVFVMCFAKSGVPNTWDKDGHILPYMPQFRM